MELREVMMGTGPGAARTPNQNLINQSKEEHASGRPPGFWKSIIVDMLSILSALSFGYSYFGYLITGLSPWYLFAAFLLVALSSVLQVYLARSQSRRALVIFGESLALVVFFTAYAGWTMLLASLVAAYAFLSWGYLMGRTDARNAVEVQFLKTTRSVLGSVVTGLLIVMILIYAPQAKGEDAFISEANFRRVYTLAAGFMDNFYPGLPFGGSFGDLSQSYVRSQFEGDPAFEAMTPAQKNAAIEQAITKLSGSVEKSTGVAPAPSEPVSDVVYRAIIAVFSAWQGELQGKFTLAWALVLFIALRTIGTVFVWVAQFVSLVIYEALLAAGFMHISSFTQTKEEVVY